MKIEKFKKDKSNIYSVFFEDGLTVKLYDDVIIKYNLLVSKEMDNKLFDEIVKYNDFLSGYYKSIKYINKKLRTELEINKYLNKLGVSRNNINKIIELLYKDGYLNKDMYLKAYINDQYNLTSNGPLKIKRDLEILGYDENDIELVLDNYEWINRIERIINKKVKVNKSISNNSLKNKIINDIINLGYLKEDILYYLDKYEFNDDYDSLTKELIKVKKKYSNKYNGYDLENRVISYLFKKGYNIDDIKRCYNENQI